jgi:uncharacterized protein
MPQSPTTLLPFCRSIHGRSIHSSISVAALASVIACMVGVTAAAEDVAPIPTTIAIGAIQGRGDASPMIGREVVIEGVVTALIYSDIGPNESPADDGWFVQDTGDGDPATSDALFVIDQIGPPLVQHGQRVRVRGTVVELDSGRGVTRTALQLLSVVELGKGRLPKPQRFSAPPANWEPYEHMRVRIDTPLTVAGTDRASKYGELRVNFGERLRTPTEVAMPGDAANALAADNARRSLRLDDASAAESPPRLWYLPQGLPRTGSLLSRVEGVVDQREGGYRLQLTAVPRIKPAPRPDVPNVAGDLRIVAFNLENMFNGDGRGGGFPTPRGAKTAADYRAQLDRHLATIRALKPDVLALMELENDGYGPDSSIAALVAAMREAGLGDDWRFIDAGEGPGTDQIRVALLYRAQRVEAVGVAATLTGGPFENRSRVPLAQSFRALAGANPGPVFTIAVNHFKSKGCGSPTGDDADQGDGQGCWNATRTDSARRVGAWLRSDPTRSGSDLAMIVGDLNAYGMEDPIQTLIADGWRDAYAGVVQVPYSYVYDGQTGRLDHALLSPSLAQRLAGAVKWHSNADEPERTDRGGNAAEEANLRRRNDNARSVAEPWRSSDHDPLLLGFRLRR